MEYPSKVLNIYNHKTKQTQNADAIQAFSKFTHMFWTPAFKALTFPPPFVVWGLLYYIICKNNVENSKTGWFKEQNFMKEIKESFGIF